MAEWALDRMIGLGYGQERRNRPVTGPTAVLPASSIGVALIQFAALFRAAPATTQAHMALITDDTDEALMARYQRGEVRAFEELLRRHRRPVFQFIFRCTQDRPLAEDLVQDCFLRVVRSSESYEQHSKFTTWLYTIARNLCVDASRRAKHRRTVSLDAPLDRSDAEGETRMDRVKGERPLADRDVINQQLSSEIERAVALLPEDQREVFILREILDLPFKEIAAIVKIPENTVKSRMRYALEKLREELNEFADLAKALP